MPGFDRSGPAGQGAMTGRQRGLCTDSSSSFSNNVFGNLGRGLRRGFGGRGGGGGRGFRFGQQANFQNESATSSSTEKSLLDEVKVLREQMEGLKTQLREIRSGKND